MKVDNAALPQSSRSASDTLIERPLDVATFGSCEMRPKRRELRRDGNLQPVPRRVFDCLHYLLDHRDRVVGKDELVDAVWVGACVSDSVVARTVMKVRRIVGDDAGSPSIIKTIHGVGYRFIASVTLFARGGGASSSGAEIVKRLESTDAHTVRSIALREPRDDSRQCFCDWAYSRALRAVQEDRWLVAARLFELAINLGYGERSHTLIDDEACPSDVPIHLGRQSGGAKD